MKKVLSLLLALVMAFSTVQCLSVVSSAAYDESGVFQYDYENGTVVITDVSADAEGRVTVPSEIDGDTVTAIGDKAFQGCDKITEVVLPSTVTKIGYNAFYGCTSLESIDLGKVKQLDCEIFEGCMNLKSLVVPSTLRSSDYNSYNYVGPLGESGIETLTFEDATTTITSYICSGMSYLKTVVIPDSVSAINTGAFRNCVSLEQIDLPESLTDIGNSAFRNCSLLVDIKLPSSVKSIGDSAFADCKKLNTVDLNDVQSIGTNAFEGCIKLKSITIPNTLLKTDYNSYSYSGPFAESGVETVIFEEGITKLPNYVCSTISNLKNVTIPDGVTTIGNYAFYNCAALEEITLPDPIAEIGSHAFSNCASLTGIELPESVETIGAGAFSECSELLSIDLAKVQLIGTNAFGGCLKLKSITIPNTLLKTDYNSYSYSGPFAESGIETVIFEEGITKLPNYVCSTISNLKNVTIPDGVTTIGNYAFYNCTALEEMALPQGATTIGSNAFGGCSKLKKINLPDTLLEINSNSFKNCSQLQEVTTVKNSAGWKYFENKDVSIIEISCSHPYNEEIMQQDATCTEPGYTYGLYCPYCEIWVEGHEIIPAVGHIASDPVIENEAAATCTANGSYDSVVYCKTCHEELSRTKATTDKIAHKIVTIKATPATCTKTGLTEGKKCSVCGEILTAQTVVSKKAHSYTTTTTKATTSKDGKIVTACTACGKVAKTVVIAKPSTVALSAVSYTYDGKVKTPPVTVKNSKGTALKNGTDYTVTYASGRKNPGQYAVKVTFKGNYSGSKMLYFTILPGVTSKIVTTTSASAVKLTWKAVPGATGYRVYLYNASTKKYTALKTTTATSCTATNLKSGTSYKFAIKAYTTVSGKVYWSSEYQTVTATTNPGTPTLKVTAGSKKATLSWTKQTGASGYEIYYKSGNTYKKLATVQGGNTLKYTRTGLKTGFTYTFRVRAYSVVAGKTIYGSFSSAKSVKVK